MHQRRGVALILVVFIVALGSILVLDLTYSSFLGARSNAMVERSLQAEYLLKSAVNFARALLREDNTPEDGPQDAWYPFQQGIEVPASVLGLQGQNIKVSLEIRPESAKVPLRQLVPVQAGSADKRWRDILVRLFELLGFDKDREEESQEPYSGRVFTPQEMVANLIDYQDADRENYQADNFPNGLDADVPEGFFPNTRVTRVEELRLIPGFTANRLRKLMPFVHATGNPQVNINTAPEVVLEALNPNIDQAMAKQIIAFRESKEGPFTFLNRQNQLTAIVGQDVYNQIQSLVTVESGWFQVIAKVDYGTSNYFLRAFLVRDAPNNTPEIQSMELF